MPQKMLDLLIELDEKLKETKESLSKLNALQNPSPKELANELKISDLKELKCLLSDNHNGQWPQDEEDPLTGFLLRYEFKGIEYYIPVDEIQTEKLINVMDFDDIEASKWRNIFERHRAKRQNNGYNPYYFFDSLTPFHKDERYELYQIVSNKLKGLTAQSFEGDSKNNPTNLETAIQKSKLESEIKRLSIKKQASLKAVFDELKQKQRILMDSMALVRRLLSLGFEGEEKSRTNETLMKQRELIVGKISLINQFVGYYDRENLGQQWKQDYDSLHKVSEECTNLIPEIDAFIQRVGIESASFGGLPLEENKQLRHATFFSFIKPQGALDNYLDQRAMTYYFRDLFSAMFACLLQQIFAYETERTRRERYINDKLKPAIESYINHGDKSSLGSCLQDGIAHFSPRAKPYENHYIFTLRSQLENIQLALGKVEAINQP